MVRVPQKYENDNNFPSGKSSRNWFCPWSSSKDMTITKFIHVVLALTGSYRSRSGQIEIDFENGIGWWTECGINMNSIEYHPNLHVCTASKEYQEHAHIYWVNKTGWGSRKKHRNQKISIELCHQIIQRKLVVNYSRMEAGE